MGSGVFLACLSKAIIDDRYDNSVRGLRRFSPLRRGRTVTNLHLCDCAFDVTLTVVADYGPESTDGGQSVVAISPSDDPHSFVIHFFKTSAGELRCRVTDAFTHQTWIIMKPVKLQRLIEDKRPQQGYPKDTSAGELDPNRANLLDD